MTSFAEELEIFRTEQETAQQYFFAYLGQRTLLAQRNDLLRMVNDNSLFWITSHHALIMSTFIAIGSIFDFSSKHNLGNLRRIVEANPLDFTTVALQARRTSDLGAYAATYVQGKHGMTPAQWRPIADKIDSWTAVYVDRYKPIRHQFAHRRLSTLAQVNALLAKTNIDEMKAMFAFMHALYGCLDQLWINGEEPVLRERDFILPPDPMPNNNYMPGEKAYRQAQDVLLSMKP
jgi:hypothetical protein